MFLLRKKFFVVFFNGFVKCMNMCNIHAGMGTLYMCRYS